jgi:hypothetical protein
VTEFIAASSVDAERAFSGGRLQVNHLQHQTSSQTFKARVALGSWVGTPLMPGTSTAAAIIEKKLKGKKAEKTAAKGKGKEKETEILSDRDDEGTKFYD